MRISDWYTRRKEVKLKAIQDAQKAQLVAKAKEAEAAKLDKQYADAIAKVVIFAGDIAEYERSMGYEPGSVVPCNTSTKQEIFLRYGAYLNGDFVDGVVNNNDIKLRNRLIDQGLEAVVHAKPVLYMSDRYFARYGLPVKKAK